jgi:hypothetical protein
MRALNRHVERVFIPIEGHALGKRNLTLKRDERGPRIEAAYNIRIAPNNTTTPVKVDPTHTFSKVSMMLSQSGLTTRVGLVDGAHRACFWSYSRQAAQSVV